MKCLYVPDGNKQITVSITKEKTKHHKTSGWLSICGKMCKTKHKKNVL